MKLNKQLDHDYEGEGYGDSGDEPEDNYGDSRESNDESRDGHDDSRDDSGDDDDDSGDGGSVDTETNEGTATLTFKQ